MCQPSSQLVTDLIPSSASAQTPGIHANGSQAQDDQAAQVLADRLQERWEDAEEDYYKPKGGASLAQHSNGDDLDIDAGDTSSGKVKRMHPFGQGIR